MKSPSNSSILSRWKKEIYAETSLNLPESASTINLKDGEKYYAQFDGFNLFLNDFINIVADKTNRNFNQISKIVRGIFTLKI